MNNDMQRKFNEWIGKTFKGLSANTLYQLIVMQTTGIISLPKERINNMIYVDLFNVFIGKATEKERNNYDTISCIVSNCKWI